MREIRYVNYRFPHPPLRGGLSRRERQKLLMSKSIPFVLSGTDFKSVPIY